MTYDSFDLSGKTAVITGGNGGIGLGFARAIAAPAAAPAPGAAGRDFRGRPRPG